MSSTARLLMAALLLAAAPPGVAAQDWRTITSMRQVGGEDLLRVSIEYGAGQLEIGRASPGVLYRAGLRYDADVFHPEMSYRAGSLKFGLEDVRVRGRNMKSGQLDLDLGPDVPLDIRVQFGAARADLDLTGLQVTRLRVATGASETVLRIDEPNRVACESVDLDVGAASFKAFGLGNLNAERVAFSGGVGEVTLDFTGEATRDVEVDIEMGLGSLTLRVPRGAGVQFRKSGLLVGFDSQGLVKRGDRFFSQDWETADHRITFEVRAALGSINMVWVDPGDRPAR